MVIRENFNFYEGQNLVLAFEELLKSYGIEVRRGSDLEDKFLHVFDVLFKFEEREKIDPKGDYRSLFRDFSALYDLALKIMSIKNHNEFSQIVPHLKKMNECNIAQNFLSKITDQDANKIIELYLAALCMRFCRKITLDHPEKPKGDNPDVIAEFQGKLWGFACKTLHTRNSKTIYQRLVEAIDQIEKSNSEVGIPVINLKNILDHNSIWPQGKTFPSANEPFSVLFGNINDIQNSMINDIGLHELKGVFENKKSLPGILFVAQSASSVFRFETMSSTATRLHTMVLFKIDEDKFTPEAIQIISALNHYMQLAN